MIQFPETAVREWNGVAARVEKSITVRQKVEREVQVANEVEKHWVRHESKLAFEQSLAASETPPLEIGFLEDYLSNPATIPSDIIEGVVKEGGLTLVLGPSGAGKSTIALQLVHAMFTGTPFLHQQVQTPMTGGFGAISYDMDASMLTNWMSGWPTNFMQGSVSVVNAHKSGNPLAVPMYRQQIVDVWRSINTEVVLIDSFSASFTGSDQNDAAATMAHYRDLKKFALTEVGAKSLIVVVHASPGSATKARGSTVHQDVADSILSIEKVESKDPADPNSGFRRLTMAKYREMANSGVVEMPPIMIGKPDPTTHLVKEHVGNMEVRTPDGNPTWTQPIEEAKAQGDDPDEEQEQE